MHGGLGVRYMHVICGCIHLVGRNLVVFFLCVRKKHGGDIHRVRSVMESIVIGENVVGAKPIRLYKV